MFTGKYQPYYIDALSDKQQEFDKLLSSSFNSCWFSFDADDDADPSYTEIAEHISGRRDDEAVVVEEEEEEEEEEGGGETYILLQN